MGRAFLSMHATHSVQFSQTVFMRAYLYWMHTALSRAEGQKQYDLLISMGDFAILNSLSQD